MVHHSTPALAERRRVAPPLIPGYGPGVLVGHGWLGTTWRMEHTASRTVVAARMFERAAEAGLALGFAEAVFERAALASSLHPLVVAPVGAGSLLAGLAAGTTDVPFVTTPWPQGRALAAVAETSPIPLATSIQIVRDLAAVLVEAAAAGPHLGLHPHNVFLGDGAAATVRVVDFGVVAALGDEVATFAAQHPGRAEWLAPELRAGEPGTHASDAWSVGSLLGWLIAHAPAHERTFELMTAARALRDRLTDTEPSRRPQNPTDLVRALAKATVGTPLAPAPSTSRPWPLPRRDPNPSSPEGVVTKPEAPSYLYTRPTSVAPFEGPSLPPPELEAPPDLRIPVPPRAPARPRAAGGILLAGLLGGALAAAWALTASPPTVAAEPVEVPVLCEPVGATIVEAGVTLGTCPLALVFDSVAAAPRQLTISAPGYTTEVIEVAADQGPRTVRLGVSR